MAEMIVQTEITDSRSSMFSGKLQKQLFHTLVLQGYLRMDDVRRLLGSRERVEQFLALVNAVHLGSVDYSKSITGTLVYLPEK